MFLLHQSGDVSLLSQIQMKTNCCRYCMVQKYYHFTCILHTIHACLLIKFAGIILCVYTCAIVLIRDSMVCCGIWD